MFKSEISGEVREEQSLTNLRATVKDINKFTVHIQSSNESIQSQKQKPSRQTSSVRRLKRMQQSELGPLKPSIMSQFKDDDQFFDEVINLGPFTVRKVRNKRKFFQQDNEVIQKSIKKQEKQKQMKNIFDISQSQSDKQQKIITQRKTNKLLFIPNYDDTDEFQNPQEKTQQKNELNNSSVENISSETELQAIDLVKPQQSILHLSHELTRNLLNASERKSILSFLLTPIPKGIRFTFQIHKYKKFMKSQYELWICFQQSMSLLATSFSNEINLDSQVFKMFLKYPVLNLKQKQEQNFIAKLVSDFKRNQYILFDHQNTSKPKDSDKILATIFSFADYLGDRTQELYVPKVQDKRPKTIFNNTVSKSLRKLYSLPQFKNQISKFRNVAIPPKILNQISLSQKVLRNTTRNGILKDFEQDQTLILFKVQKDRFKIFAGPGITPLQILAFSTVHLQ